MKNHQGPQVSFPCAGDVYTQARQKAEMGFTGEEKWERKTGAQGKGSGRRGPQRLFIRLISEKKTSKNPTIVRSAT